MESGVLGLGETQLEGLIQCTTIFELWYYQQLVLTEAYLYNHNLSSLRNQGDLKDRMHNNTPFLACLASQPNDVHSTKDGEEPKINDARELHSFPRCYGQEASSSRILAREDDETKF
ncbi:hypothetical protein VNO77_34447 [Canavalia gladiata]|uniref:Uncharacterized protein n=1 Tax=Canavalia gladiata TaxID=3824 RepID=A0AAN9KDL4_CANGL